MSRGGADSFTHRDTRKLLMVQHQMLREFHALAPVPRHGPTAPLTTHKYSTQQRAIGGNVCHHSPHPHRLSPPCSPSLSQRLLQIDFLSESHVLEWKIKDAQGKQFKIPMLCATKMLSSVGKMKMAKKI